tara:strand:- start:616 stop:765 length:150 start_codon:yes stop_codon:yes gene_type:complete
LDVSIQAQVINLMMDLQKEFDVSFLFIAPDHWVACPIVKKTNEVKLNEV